MNDAILPTRHGIGNTVGIVPVPRPIWEQQGQQFLISDRMMVPLVLFTGHDNGNSDLAVHFASVNPLVMLVFVLAQDDLRISRH
jgi:hypothetical protein